MSLPLSSLQISSEQHALPGTVFATAPPQSASMRIKALCSLFGLRHAACTAGIGLLMLLGGFPTSARALEPAVTRQEPVGVPPKEVAAIVADLDDIAGMRPLLPLKLTVEQLDNMVTILVAARVIYDRDIGQIPGPIVTKMTDEIRAVKKAALRGEPIPKDFDDKIKKADRELLTKRDKINAKNLGNVCDRLNKILTLEQVKTAVAFDKARQPARAALIEGTDDQWFASYVVYSLLNNPRIVPVLRLMREAKVPYAKDNPADKSGNDIPDAGGK